MLSVVLVAGISGCASLPEDVRQLPADARPVELIEVPFFPQELYQCGPAALATTLVSSGVDVTVDDLVGKVYLPGRQGSLQVELLAAARTSGRIAYETGGTLAYLHAELESGRPVLVLQNLGIAAIPRWHYAVVVGIDPHAGTVVLRSGIDERRVTSVRTFLHTWRRSDYWAMVTLRPGEVPALPDRARFIAAIAAFEQAGQQANSVAAWEAALSQWPDDRLALFGLANAHYAQGEYGSAESAFRKLLLLDGGNAIARNNLAMALVRQDRFEEAVQQVDLALQNVSDETVRAELRKTRATAISRVNEE